jgi:hypothetical protein
MKEPDPALGFGRQALLGFRCSAGGGSGVSPFQFRILDCGFRIERHNYLGVANLGIQRID